MKKHLFALCLLPLGAAAVDTSSLAFTEKRTALPSLSLLGKSAQPLPAAFLDDAAAWFRSQGPQILGPKQFVSHMPIVSPKTAVDSRMPVKIPDASTDYKLIVVAPNVESAK